MMSFFSNVKDAVRKYLRIPSIEEDVKALEADVKALEADVKALNESVASADINVAKVQAAVYNDQLKLNCMLHELENAISESNAKLESERRHREDAEKQLVATIAMLTNKINRIESLADQRSGSIGNHKEQ